MGDDPGYARDKSPEIDSEREGVMAAKKKAAKAQRAAVKARYNPYVQRLVDDEDLRQNIVQAFESSRDAFARLSNGKSPSKQIFDDKKLQKDLKEAAESIRDASVALREAPKKQRKGGFGRIVLLSLVAGGLALALSEGLRKKVLDALFGAEEEFEYTSTTTAPPSTAAPTAGTTT
jgi:hypothetical protein